MFGNLIFYDKKKIDQYSAMMTGKKGMDNGDIGKFDDKSIQYLLECEEFIKLLQQREDYFDFVDSEQDISIKDVRIASIVRVTGEIFVPEKFDMVQLIEEYKSVIVSTMQFQDEDEKELVNAVLKNSKSKIPIFCELSAECDYWLGIGKVSKDNLLVEYNELEDLEGKEVTIIAKIDSRKYYRDKPLQVFDIYKDFLGLNRALRKTIAIEKDNDFESIEVEEDYLGLELLAIY